MDPETVVGEEVTVETEETPAVENQHQTIGEFSNGHHEPEHETVIQDVQVEQATEAAGESNGSTATDAPAAVKAQSNPEIKSEASNGEPTSGESGKEARDEKPHHNGRRDSRSRNGDDDDKQESEQLRKLFIGGLTYNTTEDDIREHFGKYGKIVDAVVMMDPQTKKSRCFGFVTYERAAMVDEAQKNRPHIIHERTVEPKRAIPREMSSKPGSQATVCKAFVGGVKEGVEESDLREYFSQFGTITSVDIITEKGSTKKRGFAFVTFEDYDAVDKLTLIRNHRTAAGHRLEVQKAVSKEEMGKESSYGGGGSGGRGGSDRDSGRDRDFRGGDRDRDRGGSYRGGGSSGGYNDRGYGGGGGGRSDDRGYRGGGGGRDDGDRYSGYGSRGGSGAYGGDGGSYGSRGGSMGGGGGGAGGWQQPPPNTGGGYSGYGAGPGYAPPTAAPYGGGPSYGGGAPAATAYPNYGGDYGRYGGAPSGNAGYGAPQSGGYSSQGPPDYGGSGGGGPIRSAYSTGGAGGGGGGNRPAPYARAGSVGGTSGGYGSGGRGGPPAGNYGRR